MASHVACLIAMSVWLVAALGVGGIGLFGARALVSRSCGLQAASDAAEQIGLGAGSGEGDAHAGGGLSDAGGDLEQAHAQGGELGRASGWGFGMASRTVSISQ